MDGPSRTEEVKRCKIARGVWNSGASQAAPSFEFMSGNPQEWTDDGRKRVIIENVTPEIDGGRFAIKRVEGDSVLVEADAFVDGHDSIRVVLRSRDWNEDSWREWEMEPLINDHWRGRFKVGKIGTTLYGIEAWVDHFVTWRKTLEKRSRAGQDLELEFRGGAAQIKSAADRADEQSALELKALARSLEDASLPQPARFALASNPHLEELMRLHADRGAVSRSKELRVIVDPPVARFGAWYEFFPRSTARQPGSHGTFSDCELWLRRAADLYFDVIYLPPIHPIGRSFRKGRNNQLECGPDDPGSPWAIGSEEGGHKSLHPRLGNWDDFQRLIECAEGLNLKIAMDVAFQCSPEHPYVREHPDWFRKRPDGSIQYAENPPKKYQDIYPIDFETENWEALWVELKSVFEFWIERGVRIFRVDNPHTKSFPFWEWCITTLKEKNPELIFLSEAFTRPKVMYYLAKLGFSQSYNYFPWRNTKWEITSYFTELAQSGVREFFRPNLWPNTPDILTQYLQYGGRAAFVTRLILAATLGSSYGIYGPAFELCENEPREPGAEEYLNSEKYEIRHWDLEKRGHITELIGRINRIRRENPALQRDETLRFAPVDNDRIVAYTKYCAESGNLLLIVVNLDAHHAQRGWVELPPEVFPVDAGQTFQVHDLLTDSFYLWSGKHNFVELNPVFVPAHVFRIRRHARRENDFDYFL
jgi:starch synthase (maltosyl-transferring)